LKGEMISCQNLPGLHVRKGGKHQHGNGEYQEALFSMVIVTVNEMYSVEHYLLRTLAASFAK